MLPHSATSRVTDRPVVGWTKPAEGALCRGEGGLSSAGCTSVRRLLPPCPTHACRDCNGPRTERRWQHDAASAGQDNPIKPDQSNCPAELAHRSEIDAFRRHGGRRLQLNFLRRMGKSVARQWPGASIRPPPRPDGRFRLDDGNRPAQCIHPKVDDPEIDALAKLMPRPHSDILSMLSKS